MQKIIHLIPYDAVGGVETAARSLKSGVHKGICFEKYYLVRKREVIQAEFDHHGPEISENDLRAYFRAVRHVCQEKPDLLIASLWRSCIVLILVKILKPKIRVVTFLHLANHVHWLDQFFNAIAMRMSSEIWADSQTTLNARVPVSLRTKGRVISFVTKRFPKPEPKQAEANFIFWGRLHLQKDIPRAIRIFHGLHKIIPDATFQIIGPDGGEKTALQAQVRELGLSGSVEFSGSMEQCQIFEIAKQKNFFLQTSISEGMAMSVVEAMQLGLVPIVTPVGEISAYCRDSVNAVLVEDEDLTIEKLITILENPTQFSDLSERAIATWNDRPLYRDDVVAACKYLTRENSICVA